MASLLEDLVQWIVLAGLAVQDGVDIFRDYSPEQPDKLSILYEYDSLLSDVKGNDACVRYIQVITRDTSPTASRSKCVELFHLFSRPEETVTDLPSGRWTILIPRQLPFKIKVDDKGRTVYGFNVAITTNPD